MAFLWLKVVKKHGVPKICVFLGRIFGISLASGSKETWHSQNSCLSGYLNYILWVSSLAGVVNWKKSVKLHTLLLLERCEICGKVNLFWSILACVVHTFSESECFCMLGAGQKAHFYLVFM